MRAGLIEDAMAAMPHDGMVAMVEAAASSLWETERWHFMESYAKEVPSVREHFNERARAALEAAFAAAMEYSHG